eukprot:TRINITY_DN11097_c0_g1_i1.p1 TRINITY_DN11097_c0_g1~~TRINITY_DN11097_c0_g1_i1.p1  ORF type:complete len:115 (+),score=1.77 TRINITY_DN11097_c0_g1_i1:46-390(+)
MLVIVIVFFFFLLIRRPPRSTLSSSSAASDVYKRQIYYITIGAFNLALLQEPPAVRPAISSELERTSCSGHNVRTQCTDTMYGHNVADTVYQGVLGRVMATQARADTLKSLNHT